MHLIKAGVDAFADNLKLLLDGAGSGPIGLAVSGGGDSMALLRMAADLKQHAFQVATIDHGLRDGSADEALMVADVCDRLGLLHITLKWSDWDKSGNLQDAARGARRRLLSKWASENNISAVCLGHTLDDQAETFLMRLARGSGVDGLASMYPTERSNGVSWLRPLIATSRDELRTYLGDINQEWIDDPSNDDDQFDRIKMRNAKAALADLGLNADRLGRTATHMQNARLALEHHAQIAAQTCMTATNAGSVIIDRPSFLALGADMRGRVLTHALAWVSPAVYRPRFASVTNLISSIEQGIGHTLAGCQTRFSAKMDQIEIAREVNCISSGMKEGLFDGKWRISAPLKSSLNVAPLGEKGLSLCEDWRSSGVSRITLMATPAIWDQDGLIAAPFAGKVSENTFELESSVHEFLTSFVTH